MFILVIYTLLAVLLATGVQLFLQLRVQIEAAKKTGLKYVILPYPNVGIAWGIFNSLVLPYLRKLPVVSAWDGLKLLDKQDAYLHPRSAQSKYGDTFLLITPFQPLKLRTSSPELISQITHLSKDFIKPVRLYKLLDIFGKSIVSVEGHDWRRFKKVVGPSFSEKSNRLVFEESVRQAEGMIRSWGAMDEDGEVRVERMGSATAVLSLHVICAAGFGLRQFWLGERERDLNSGDAESSVVMTGLTGDHTMTLKESLQSLLGGIRWLVLLPRWLLRISPLKAHIAVMKAHTECLAYFEELRESKKQQIGLGERDDEDTMDLMGPMVRTTSTTTTHNPRPLLTPSEITGNAFIFFFAGHETTANALHFSLLHLALYPSSQRATQASIGRIVGTKPSSGFSYTEDMPRLYNSMVGAVLNETLRLIPAIISIPKEAHGPQSITLENRELVIPDKTFIQIDIVGVNRNEKYWPTSPSLLNPNAKDDIHDFVPTRWLLKGGESKELETETLLTPPKGAYMTFSDGARACPGRRFAQVEVTAVLTTILQKWSVELDVGVDDVELDSMNLAERRKVYADAVERGKAVLARCSQRGITLQMQPSDRIPVRFVRRGLEKFGNM